MTEREVSSERVSEERVYLIRKGDAWYRPDSAGYTTNAHEAGRYTLEEAEKITHPNGPNGPRDAMSYQHQDTVPALRSSVKTVGVKKLEWSDPAPPTDGVSYYDHCLAVSALGEYRIEWKSWKRYDGFCVYGPLEFFESENTLEAAKAAAQADYERCILSAIEAPAAASEVADAVAGLKAERITAERDALDAYRKLQAAEARISSLEEENKRLREALGKLTHLYESDFDPEVTARPDWLISALEDRNG